MNTPPEDARSKYEQTNYFSEQHQTSILLLTSEKQENSVNQGPTTNQKKYHE